MVLKGEVVGRRDIEEIRRLFLVAFTISIFMLMTIERFLNLKIAEDILTHTPNELTLRFSIGVGIYVFAYLFFGAWKEHHKNLASCLIYSLKINIFLMGVLILHAGTVSVSYLWDTYLGLIINGWIVFLINHQVVWNGFPFLTFFFASLGVIYENVKTFKLLEEGFFVFQIKKIIKRTFSKPRIKASIHFSLVLGVTLWATTVYRAAEGKHWAFYIGAWLLIAFILLIFGGSFLDILDKEKKFT